jgi:TRAP-type C4-dicarboxylate transport system substrate-binding protein
MDGQENPFSQIYSAKFHEVQKFLSLTGHVYTPAYIVVGTKKWASLPADVRKTLEGTAKDVQKFVYAAAEKDENELLGKIKSAGVQVNEADKAAFVKASKAVYDDFGKEVKGSKDLIDKALALAR